MNELELTKAALAAANKIFSIPHMAVSQFDDEAFSEAQCEFNKALAASEDFKKQQQPDTLTEEAKELAIWRSGRVPLLIEREAGKFIVSDRTFSRESVEKLKSLYEEQPADTVTISRSLADNLLGTANLALCLTTELYNKEEILIEIKQLKTALDK